MIITTRGAQSVSEYLPIGVTPDVIMNKKVFVVISFLFGKECISSVYLAFRIRTNGGGMGLKHLFSYFL
jgi:hypothetical protein